MIILGGIKHCGKSTLGRLIAEETGARFFDLDDLILSETGGSWNSVRDLYINSGADFFRQLEEEAARNFTEWILPEIPRQACVLSLGGGAVENQGAMGWLRQNGTRVYIRADCGLLYKRIMAGGRPPFLSKESPQNDFKQMYDRRDALYTDFAQVIHNVDDSPPDVNARRLLVSLEKHNAR